jgi:hypothetical protein
VPGSRRWTVGVICFGAALLCTLPAHAAAEVKLDKDFLAGVIAKLPSCPFDKAGKYRGSVHSYRLAEIDPRARRFLIDCQIEGEFHTLVTGPISEHIGRDPETPEGWRKFRFDIKAKVNIEPGADGAPKFRVEVEEVKRRELEGFSGLLARFLGHYFDDIVTQLAAGRASRLNKRVNDEILKRVNLFKEYGVFCGIDYASSGIVLQFDVTRFRSEGVAGYVFVEGPPGTVPLYRWVDPGSGAHYYTTTSFAPDQRNSVSEGIACYVYPHSAPQTIPLYHWRSVRDDLYTTSAEGERSGRFGYRSRGVACYLYPDQKPGTVPLYRFYDPVRHQHFYTTHPRAEFAK